MLFENRLNVATALLKAFDAAFDNRAFICARLMRQRGLLDGLKTETGKQRGSYDQFSHIA